MTSASRQVLVGAGTVTDAETAGARWMQVRSYRHPCLVPEVIDAARQADVAVLRARSHATEVLERFGRAGHGEDLSRPERRRRGLSPRVRGPFPDIPLVPTGGVTLEKVSERFDAGAAAVGVGSELISKDALAGADYAAISALASQFLAAAARRTRDDHLRWFGRAIRFHSPTSADSCRPGHRKCPLRHSRRRAVASGSHLGTREEVDGTACRSPSSRASPSTRTSSSAAHARPAHRQLLRERPQHGARRRVSAVLQLHAGLRRTRTDLARRLDDGSTALAYDDAALAKIDLSRGTADLPGWATAYTAEELRRLLDAYRSVNEDKLWDNFAYFLERVVPVAASSGVRMALHPDDPPWSIFGLPRIITNGAALERVTNIVDDPANGITFCAGSLAADPRNDLPDMIRRLGAKGRIHFAHCRNIRRIGARSFQETAHPSDLGDIDRRAVLGALHETGFAGRYAPIRTHDLGRDGQPGYACTTAPSARCISTGSGKESLWIAPAMTETDDRSAHSPIGGPSVRCYSSRRRSTTSTVRCWAFRAHTQRELHWTESDYGDIVSGSASPMRSALVAGVDDWTGVRRGWRQPWWVSVARWATPCETAVGFSIARAMLGVASRQSYGVDQAIAEWFPQKERALRPDLQRPAPTRARSSRRCWCHGLR